jgi:hypothetical protein
MVHFDPGCFRRGDSQKRLRHCLSIVDLVLPVYFCHRYLNYAPEATTFTAKLTLSMVTVVLAVIAVLSYTTLSATKPDYAQDVHLVEAALFSTGQLGQVEADDLPTEVVWVVSSPLSADPLAASSYTWIFPVGNRSLIIGVFITVI